MALCMSQVDRTEVMCGDTEASPHIHSSITDLTVEITDRDERYRFVSLDTAFHHYCRSCRE